LSATYFTFTAPENVKFVALNLGGVDNCRGESVDSSTLLGMRYADVPVELRDRPFTLAQANAAGVSSRMLEGQSWRQIFRGVWAHCAMEDTRELRFDAVRLLQPEHAVVCVLTAAWLHGAEVRHQDDLDVDVSYPKGKRRRPRQGLRVSQETVQPDDVTVIQGVRVTTGLRTTFDCLRLLKGIERVVVADALTHLGRTNLEELQRYFAAQRRLRNLRIGERLIEQVEPLSESPMESRVRLRLTEAGIPRPKAQWEIFTPSGEFVARLDLAWPEFKVAVEYDGAWHWKQRQQDDRRRARARALGWDIHVFGSEDYYGDRDAMIAEVWAALRARQERALGTATPTAAAAASASLSAT
jgi:hypothetical protein